MELINLTPHALHLINTDGSVATVGPQAVPARVALAQTEAGTVNGIPLYRAVYGEVQDLPAPKDGVLYLVSLLVRQACPERTDLASPGDLVRNEAGQIIGCKVLLVN